MNITTPLGITWVAVGLLGQVLFAGRMLVQWLVSERRGRSVIPVAFWWMSLLGASMLLIYFLWRKDVVGVLGQTTGWTIYMRNLWLIYRRSLRRRLASDPAPQPQLSTPVAASDGQTAD
ncbi:MAG: lipid-A-disaccharide synthase N-terminal domain-containing protein [Planctomycetota bacterium]|nr:lipid-A-disaccharide synthase N-terminal domain-containing protein [Planctomycetota bacterium]